MGVVEDIRLTQSGFIPTDGERVEQGIKLFDLEDLCPIDLIRTHTKTDDVPFVTDEQLRLYRKVAFENSQQYSAILCGPRQQVVEVIRHKRPYPSMARPHRHLVHETQYPAWAPQAFIYGGVARANKPINIHDGQRRIRIITHSPDMFFDSCCSDPCGNFDPCAGENDMRLQYLMYYSGYKTVGDVPSGIVLGMLKFMAWSIMRPGDELLTQRNRTSIAEGGITGTNNAAWASGALELWVQYDDLRV